MPYYASRARVRQALAASGGWSRPPHLIAPRSYRTSMDTPEPSFSVRYLFELEMERLRKKPRPPDPVRDLLAIPTDEPAAAGDALDDYLGHRSRRLERAVSEMRDELFTRIELRDRTLEQIDYQISRAAFSLKTFTGFGLGYNTGVDVRRNLLERQLTDLRRQRRHEELNAWEDVVTVRKELRRAQDELADAERRSQLASG